MDTGEQTFMGKPASVIRFNKLTGQLEKPVILLKTRNGETLGKLQYTNLNLSFVAKGLDNLSFDVHKTVDGKECECWDRLIDLCIIDYVGYGQFECHVSTHDAEETVKTCICESLETELGQHIIREMHINDEDAIIHNDPFIPTVLYDNEDKAHSLLHRVLAEKTPHWEIGYVSPVFAINGMVYDAAKLQRTFTISEKTPYDFFDEDVSAAFSCVFTYDTYRRKVNCYNLEDCVYDRNTHEILEGCYYLNNNYYDASDQLIADNSHLAHCEGIGEDTSIFLSKNKLANSFSLDSDAGSIKNCFYVTGGDDMITDTVAVANVTGNNYIYLFGNFQYDDMSKELVDAIGEYSDKLKSAEETFTQTGGVYIHNDSDYSYVNNVIVNKKQEIVTDAKYIDGKVYVLDPLAYYKDEQMYDREDNLLSDDEAVYEKPGLYIAYTNVLDRINYWEHSRFPDVEVSDTTAEEQKKKIENHFTTDQNPVYIQSVCSSDAFSHVTANIESVLSVICDSRYSIDVLKDNTHTITCDPIDKDNPNGYWNGYVSLTRDYKPKDTARFNLKIPLRFVRNTDESIAFCKQKMDIAIAKMDIKELDFIKLSDDELKNLISQFNLASVKAFRDGFASCRSMLDDLYANMQLEESQIPSSEAMLLSRERYNTRFNIADEIYKSRVTKIENLNGEKKFLEDEIEKFRANLDMKTILGEKLWKEFRSYVREDTYNNNNYVSDGLTTSETLAKAKELLDAAKKELGNACMIQYSVSSDLNNIFTLQEKEILHDKFAMFNYVRVRIDDSIYKLRLMDISFSEETPEKLDVTFSQQIESVGGNKSDQQKILEQSQSIATSYSATITQAKQGAQALNNFNVLKQEGLDSSLYLIKNSNTEEVTFGNTGIACKSMLDSGIYSPNQLAITHNGIYMTDNGFDSIKTAFGLFKYNGEWKYGLNTDVIIGDLIIGKKMIIQNVNENGQTSVTIDKDGIDITNGSIALSGNDYSIEIDPNHNNTNTLNNYLLCVRKKNTNERVMSVNTKGDAYFKGELETSKGIIGKWTIGDAIYNGTSSATSTVAGTYIGTDAIRQYNSDERYVHIQGGKLTCNDAEIRGTIHASGGTFNGDITSTATITGGSIVGGTISGGSISIGDGNFAVNSSGQLTAKNANISGAIYADYFQCEDKYYKLIMDTGIILTNKTDTHESGFHIRGKSGYTSLYANILEFGLLDKCEASMQWTGEEFLFDKRLVCEKAIYTGSECSFHVSTKGDGLYNDVSGRLIIFSDGENHNDMTMVANPDYTTSIYGDGNIWKNGSATTYFSTSTTSSDKRLKNYVADLSEFEIFFMNLSPIEFKYHDGLYNTESTEPLIKWGFYAQDIIDNFKNNGLDWKDYDLVIKEMTDISSEEKKYIDDTYDGILKVSYQKFTALNTHMLQKAYKKIEQQQKQINQQQSEIASLKETISSFMQNN